MYIDDDHLPALSDEDFMAGRSRIRPYVVCILSAGPKYEDPDPGLTSPVAKIIVQHGKRNTRLQMAGIVPIICPIGDGGPIKGIGIFATSLEEADRILSGDPGVKEGVFTYELHPTATFPDSCLH